MNKSDARRYKFKNVPVDQLPLIHPLARSQIKKRICTVKVNAGDGIKNLKKRKL